MTITITATSSYGPRVAQFDFTTGDTIKAVGYALHEFRDWIAPEDMDLDDEAAAVEYHIVSVTVH